MLPSSPHLPASRYYSFTVSIWTLNSTVNVEEDFPDRNERKVISVSPQCPVAQHRLPAAHPGPRRRAAESAFSVWAGFPEAAIQFCRPAASGFSLFRQYGVRPVGRGQDFSRAWDE